MLAAIPADQLLLETDSPYLSPEPYRGKTNTPARMVTIYAEAARIRGVTAEHLAQQILCNFNSCSLFAIHPYPWEDDGACTSEFPGRRIENRCEGSSKGHHQ